MIEITEFQMFILTVGILGPMAAFAMVRRFRRHD